MTYRAEIEESWVKAGLDYYVFRALPLEILERDYGREVAGIIGYFEALARMKWRFPGEFSWTTEKFQDKIEKLGLDTIIRIYKGLYDLPVIVPFSTFFFDAFASYPNLLALYGDRYMGKTIMAWVTAYATFKRVQQKDFYDDVQTYVYGDIDGLAASVKKHTTNRKFAESIIQIDDYTPPKEENRVAKIIIYNELGKEHMSGGGVSNEKKELDQRLFRSRHYYFWIIHNVIRYMKLEKTARVIAPFEACKPLSKKEADEIIKEQSGPMSIIYKWALSDLDIRYAFTSFSLSRIDVLGLKRLGSRMFYSFTPVIPPEWLLEADKKAEKNYNVGTWAIKNKEWNMVKKGAEYYIQLLSVRKVGIAMEEEYGFKKHHSWWADMLFRYFIKFGYKSLVEVKNDIRSKKLTLEKLRELERREDTTLKELSKKV